MANGVLTQTAGPRKISVPLTKVVIGVGVGLVQLGAQKFDEGRGNDPNKITSAQNVVPLVLTAVGIVLSIMKGANMRSIGNDLALVGGTLSTLRLSTIVSATAATRRFGGRKVSLRRGFAGASRSVMPYGMSANLSSLG